MAMPIPATLFAEDAKIALARKRLSYFSQYVWQDDPANRPNAPMHDEWYDILQYRGPYGELFKKHRRFHPQAPREHAKTTCLSVKYPLFTIGHNPNIRLLVCSRTATLAYNILGEVRRNIEYNTRLKAVFPALEPDAPWTDSQFTVKRTRIDKSPTMRGVGLHGTITGGRADKIILDDPFDENEARTPSQREKIVTFIEKVVIPTLTPEGELIAIGCLGAGTKVLMASGIWKNIEDIEIGERVVSYGSIETVDAVIPQGISDVYALKTPNHVVYATPNHPFLVLRGEETVFIRLDELERGDLLVCHQRTFGGYRNFSLTTDAMWVLGFMYGDGWITLHPNDKGSMRWVTCVAVSKQKWKNERIKRFFKACFNTTLKETDFGYYRTEVADVGRYFEAAGFKADATAKTKRIPKYVFTLAEDLRQAFLDGFVAADGHIQRNGLSAIELSNIELIKDLKLLASSLGYKVSNVYERERITQPPHSPQPIKSHTAHISFGKRRSETVFGLVPVISIDYYEKAVTYDLTVSNTHCFIAEGLVVHNTRWHYDDYWNNLIQKSIENGGMYVVKVYRPTEDMNDPASPLKALWPDVWSVDQLLARKAEIGTIRFNSLYLNDPSGYEGLIFKEKWLRYYNPYSLHFIQNMQLFMGVDPNISEDPTSDYTAIVVLGFDPSKGEFYVLDIFRKQIEFPDQVREIKAIYEKWRNIVQYYNLEKSNRWVGPLNVGVETVAYQKALARTVFMQGIPVKEINRKTDKLTRMVGLSPHFEGGRFHFPDPSIEPTPWLQPFIDEYVSFPKGKNDDQLDAIDCAVECADITKGKTGFYFG